MIWVLICTLYLPGAYGQLTIEVCQEMAKSNYPLVRQYGLIEQTREYSVANAAKGYLPRFSLSAKATYQSEVTKVPFSLPGITVEGLNLDQYQVVAEVNQTVWDGGHIRSQKELAKAAAEVGTQQLNVDLYALNNRVNELFFGILLLVEQLKQNVLLYEELQRNFDRISAYMANGVANEADLDAVKAEQINVLQSKTELQATRLAYERMLGFMLGSPLQEVVGGATGEGKIDLTTPSVEETVESPENAEIKRPELDLFGARFRQLEVQRRMIVAGNRPQIGLFIQGGYGNPGLNMLKNEFSPWYMGGVRLSWNFGGLYTRKNENRQVTVDQDQVGVQEATFLFNTNLQLMQEGSEIGKLRELMRRDDELITLRDRIKVAAEAKVANGTMSVIELLREINAGEQARQTKMLHRIQLLMAIYKQKNTTNN